MSSVPMLMKVGGCWTGWVGGLIQQELGDWLSFGSKSHIDHLATHTLPLCSTALYTGNAVHTIKVQYRGVLHLFLCLWRKQIVRCRCCLCFCRQLANIELCSDCGAVRYSAILAKGKNDHKNQSECWGFWLLDVVVINSNAFFSQ